MMMTRITEYNMVLMVYIGLLIEKNTSRPSKSTFKTRKIFHLQVHINTFVLRLLLNLIYGWCTHTENLSQLTGSTFPN